LCQHITCEDGEDKDKLLHDGAIVGNVTGNVSIGRSKGTTEVNLRHQKACLELAITWAATECIYVRQEAKERNSRAVAGTLTKIINEAKVTHGVSRDCCKVNRFTIRSRAKRLRPNPGILQGTVSLLLPIKPYLVDLIIQLARMRCPINVTTGLRLLNSLFAGTPFQLKLKEWKL
jgi:hypothetical protein